MTCRRYNPVRGCISIEKRVLLPHNPVRGCTPQHARALMEARWNTCGVRRGQVNDFY
jgi:hypothetical protein